MAGAAMPQCISLRTGSLETNNYSYVEWLIKGNPLGAIPLPSHMFVLSMSDGSGPGTVRGSHQAEPPAAT